jgi:predicted ATPase/DNA-binding SARP family transcriptional activator
VVGTDLDIRVLGNVEVRRAGALLGIGGAKPRMLLAVLVGSMGEVVSTDRLCEELWGDDQPQDPPGVLQGNISRLRRLLAPEARIAARPPGYVLEADEADVDVWRFESFCRTARLDTDPATRAAMYEQALACGNGRAFGEFSDRPWARGHVTRWDEMALTAREEILGHRLDSGEERTVVAELESLVAEQPLRERPWALLATALHRCGRSADALRRIGAFRAMLRDELGLDPPAAIRTLETQILESDPVLLGNRAARSTERPRHLPIDATPLVGRSADLAGIGAALRGQRLVTLVGPGGVGKTRLARRVCADEWEARAGEVHFVELAAIHDSLATVASVATAIDVQQRQHLSLEDTLVEYFRGRHALLVLDNCEHLRLAVARLAERLLGACPDLTVLATSRELLGLPGEHVWRVQPLASDSAAMSLDDVANVPAVRLFVDRAAASSPGFALTVENRDAIAQIVMRVDGLPLAIELAAARMRALSPAALAERLQSRLDLLDNAQLSPMDRHSTVGALVGWSFNLLTLPEQSLFAGLAVFAGTFALDAAEAVCAEHDIEGSSVAVLLAALVDKSMVQMTDAAAGRYRVLEPLREFGRAQLGGAEHSENSRRHAQWYLVLAERAADELDGPHEAAAAARLDRDFDNLRVAFQWCVEHADLESGGRLVVALREYSFRSMRAEVIAWADDLLKLPGFEGSTLAPLVLGVVAYGRFVRGDLDESIEYGEAACEAADRLATSTSGLAERALGNSLFYKGDALSAQRWIDRMVEDARSASSSRYAHALYMRSVAFTSVGDPQRGAETAAEALEVARRCGSPTSLAQATYALGLALEASDELVALGLLAQSADVAAKAGNRWVQAFARTEVLWLEARQGSPTRALAGFAGVIDLWFRGSDWANQWLSLRHVFGILIELHDHRAAATLHGALSAVGASYALPFEASHAERDAELTALLREELGAAEFALAVRRGASMRDGEIIEFTQGRIAALTA